MLNSFHTSENKLAHPNKHMTKAVNLPQCYFSNRSQDKKRIRMKRYLFPSLQSDSKLPLY